VASEPFLGKSSNEIDGIRSALRRFFSSISAFCTSIRSAAMDFLLSET
jgi:hypothetical protein